MRRHGTLRKWNDDRGFGFIEPNEGPPEIFVHIKGYSRRPGRPQLGERVTFDIETTREGKTRAINVRLLGVPETEPAPQPTGVWQLLAIPVFILVLIAFSSFTSPVLPVILAFLGVMSFATFLTYAFDKNAAQRGARRVPESTLHVLGLLGGWPGALLAQRLLRHKTSKPDFQFAFWVTTALNAAACVYAALNA